MAALSCHFSPQHPELRHLLTHRAVSGSFSHCFHSGPVLGFPSCQPKLQTGPQRGQMQPALPLWSGAAASPRLRVAQDTGLPPTLQHCHPRPCQAAEGTWREKGSHKTPQLHPYLRAERGLLMEIAPHKFTILPGGYFTPAGGTSHTWKAQRITPVPSQATHSPFLIPSMRTDASSCP